jgi:hypothetical protein
MHHRLFGSVVVVAMAIAPSTLLSAGCSDDATPNPVPHEGGTDAPASDAPAADAPPADAAPDASPTPDAPADAPTDAASDAAG